MGFLSFLCVCVCVFFFGFCLLWTKDGGGGGWVVDSTPSAPLLRKYES